MLAQTRNEPATIISWSLSGDVWVSLGAVDGFNFRLLATTCFELRGMFAGCNDDVKAGHKMAGCSFVEADIADFGDREHFCRFVYESTLPGFGPCL